MVLLSNRLELFSLLKLQVLFNLPSRIPCSRHLFIFLSFFISHFFQIFINEWSKLNCITYWSITYFVFMNFVWYPLFIVTFTSIEICQSLSVNYFVKYKLWTNLPKTKYVALRYYIVLYFDVYQVANK